MILLRAAASSFLHVLRSSTYCSANALNRECISRDRAFAWVRRMKLRNLLPQQWDAMSFYQRFESVAAMAMKALVTLVIIVAIIHLGYGVIKGMLGGALNPLDHKVFQDVFGDIVTVLIALEFNHSLHYVITGRKSIIQTKLILLIGLLAVTRKFIIMDFEGTTAETMFGLAAIALVLGIVYWLLHEYEAGVHLTPTLRPAQKPPGEEQLSP